MATIAEMLAEAVEHHRAGRGEQAAELYRKAAAALPRGGLSWARCKLSECNARTLLSEISRKPEETLRYYRRAIELEPNLSAAHANLAYLLSDQGRCDEARQHYDFGTINWDEFYQVISGHGICNKERLKARRKAHDDGAWVREAANAYSAKKSGSMIAA